MKRTGIAAFSDLRTPSADGVRDAITTRPSASANFFVDSLDKVSGQTSTNFTINKNQSLFNGFFNRIAVAEVVLDWGIPNVAAYWGNNTFSVTNFTTAFTASITITDGFYAVVDLMRRIIFQINAVCVAAGDPLRLELSQSPASPSALFVVSSGVGNDPFIINSSILARQLFKSTQIDSNTGSANYIIGSPLVLGTNYIDIVCQQLTYNQELKDNTTAPYNRDVLYRWYFANDNVPPLLDSIVDDIDPNVGTEQYALMPVLIPIAQGYTPFVSRRTPPITRQIRWSPEQPIGQVNFQVYDDQGRLVDLSSTAFPLGADFQFQMSLLLSED